MPERSSIKSLFNIKARFMFVIKVVGVMGEWYNLVIKTKNYHIADYNLYYVSIRENVANRIRQFLQSSK